MNYKNMVTSLLLLLTASGYSIGSQSPALMDKKSDELLTQKMREEFNSYVEQIKMMHNPEVYESHFDRIQIVSTCATLMGLVRELANQFSIVMPTVFVYKGSTTTKLQDTIVGNNLICNAMASKAAMLPPSIIIGIDLLTHPDYALTYSELRAILAHECAHISKGHLEKINAFKEKRLLIDGTLFSSLIATLCTSASDNLFKHYNIENKSYNSFITKYRLLKFGIYFVVGHGITFIGNSMYKSFIRSNEKEADVASVNVTQDVRSLISGLEKIERMSERLDNIPNRILNKMKTFFIDHPLTVERERYLQSMQ